MAGKRVGYVRVSSGDQNTERQLDGLELDKIFTDKCSGGNTKRPALEEMLEWVREDDIVFVHSMDRLARNLEDLRSLVDLITSKQASVHFIKEKLDFSGESSPMSDLLLNLLGAVAQFERSLIRERQREGIELAKKRGAYKGRKSALSPVEVGELRTLVAQGVAKSKVAREFGVSRTSVYKYLSEPEGALSQPS